MLMTTVDRIGPPLRRSRTTDHLNSIEVLQHRVLNIPIHARIKRRVDRAAIDQDEHLIGEDIIKSARRDRPLPRIDLRHFKVRREAQCFRQLVAPERAMSSDVIT